MADIDIDDLANWQGGSTVTPSPDAGTGVFDKLMTVVGHHIDVEYNKSRIKGSDYSKVYLGGLQATLSQSVNFLLQEQQADKQADLVAGQITLIPFQRDKLAAEVMIAQKQAEKLSFDTLLVQEQINLTSAQRINVELERDKIIAETALAEQNLINMRSTDRSINANTKKLTSDIDLINANIDNTIASKANLVFQREKLKAERILLKQKTATEQAQTNERVQSVDNDTGAVQPKEDIAGIHGAQFELYKTQKEGFLRDAEQKMAKMYIDTWNVQKSMDDGITPFEAGVGDPHIAAVLQKARQGIGAEEDVILERPSPEPDPTSGDFNGSAPVNISINPFQASLYLDDIMQVTLTSVDGGSGHPILFDYEVLDENSVVISSGSAFDLPNGVLQITAPADDAAGQARLGQNWTVVTVSHSEAQSIDPNIPDSTATGIYTLAAP